MLRLEEFSIAIDKQPIVNSISMTLPAQGVLALLGPNGAGKSTLMKGLAGVLPHSGVKSLQQQWPSSKDIGFMPQDYLVKSSLSVIDCVLLGQRESLGWKVSNQQKQIVMDALESLGVAHLAKRPMSSLSGGQQQLVLLAQRLSKRPKLLLLDEPTSALDLQHQLEVMAHIKRYTQEHNALAICTLHDLTLAARFADQIAMLKRGQLKAYGSTPEILTQALISDVYNIECDLLSARDNKLIIAPYRDVGHQQESHRRLISV